MNPPKTMKPLFKTPGLLKSMLLAVDLSVIVALTFFASFFITVGSMVVSAFVMLPVDLQKHITSNFISTDKSYSFVIIKYHNPNVRIEKPYYNVVSNIIILLSL